MACSRIAFLYFEPSTLPPPAVPVEYECQNTTADGLESLDAVDQPYHQSQTTSIAIPGMLHSLSELSILCYEIMQYLTSDGIVKAGEEDIRTRKHFYARLRRFRHELVRQLLFEHNLNPTTCFLR